jgi:hypothetical protein
MWLVLRVIVGGVSYFLTRNGGTAVKLFVLAYVIGIVIFRIVRYGERAHRESEDGREDGGEK